MTKQFISDCAFWAKNFNIVSSDIETLVEDEDKDILTYEIRFASGKSIKALSSKPSNLRSRKGRVVIDEAAFCEDLSEILKAAMALLMWNGSVSIISTHCGEDNPFNQLVQQIRSGELNYSLHRTTLDDALRDGLYKRICLTQGKIWTQEAQEEWRSQLYRDYGIAAEEELDCKPFSATSGKFLNKTWFEIVDAVPNGGEEVRYWDLAATSQKVKGQDPDYTVGLKLRRVDGVFYVVDVICDRFDAARVNSAIINTATSDGGRCKVRWEIEPGAAAKINSANLIKSLAGYDAAGVRPSGDKLQRAAAFASQAAAGNVKVLRASWTGRYLDELHAVPDSRHDDCLDGSSGAFNELVKRPTSNPCVVKSYSTW